MTDWLMKIGLGGVQRFISEARKTQDLRVGSQLISELAQSMGETADDLDGVTLMRPRQSDPAHWPHQLVLRLHDQNADGVRQIGAALQVKTHGPLADLLGDKRIDQYLDKTITAGMRKVDDATIRAELAALADTLEVYWVAVPIKDTLASASAELFRLYDDRRNSRTFLGSPRTGQEQPWVCSLCGERVALIRPKGKHWPDHRLFKDGEKLCALCLAKRVKPGKTIASTHALARDRFFRLRRFAEVSQQPNQQAWSRVLDQWDDLAKLPTDARLESVSETLGATAPTTFWSGANAPARSIENLSPYYAILLYDGDRMGEWFTGDRLDASWKTDDNRYEHAQGALSDALLAFAADVLDAPDTLRGEVIYAGGDEGLVLVPVDFVIPWLKYLQACWAHVHGHSETYKRPDRAGMTFSAHVSFVHAKFPLQPAIHGVHQALGNAKEIADRDCLSLRICPRSGAAAQTVLAWDELEAIAQAISLFTNWRPDDEGHAEPEAKELRRRQQVAAPLGLIYKSLGSLHGFFTPDLQDLALHQELERELLRIADCDQKPWQGEWHQVVQWLIRRGKIDPRRPGLNGEDAVAGILKVTGWLARQLEWGAPHA